MIDYQSLLSPKVKSFKPSGIRKFFDIASEMKDVISLGVGEPDFVTPWHIREAAIYSIEKGKTYYTSNWGLLELRKEISRYVERRFELSYNPENEILVTVGGSEGIDNCIRALVCEGDEVLIPQPSFVCYEPLTILAGGTPVPMPTYQKDKFKLTPEILKASITPKTKLLILPYPNNPTGALMTRAELEEIAKVLRGTNILVLSDEIYAELTYGLHHTSLANIPDMKERTVVISGFSKAYAMTGWRLGYACGPRDIIGAMCKIHQQAIMSSPTTSQFAAIEALAFGDEDIKMMRDSYDMRRQYILKRLRTIGFDVFEPEGAFYIFPDISKFAGDADEFCEKLLHEMKVAVVPGSAFGDCGKNNVRISYAYSINQIDEALNKIDRFVNK